MIVLGFILGVSTIESAVTDNGIGEIPKPQVRLIGNPVYRNQVRRQRPGLSAPPYAVPMEPVFKYSQRDPLYDGSSTNANNTEPVAISAKADYDVEQTKNVLKRIPLPFRGRKPNPHQQKQHHRPPQHHHHYPQYYPEPPEPIIEIIIKESNISLPAPTTTPPPPTTKEPIHVFYVKYKKNPHPTEHGDEIIYEEPIPALTPHQTEIVEGEQPNYGPTFAEPVGTPPPPPSTTLRTIIRPDSETYHGHGLKVTFGRPEKHGHEAVYGQSAPQPQVALPEEKKSIEDEEEESTEEIRHSYAKRQQPYMNKQQRQDQPLFQEQLQYRPQISQSNPQQVNNHRFPDQNNHRNLQQVNHAQHPFQTGAVFQSGGRYQEQQQQNISPTGLPHQNQYSDRPFAQPTQEHVQHQFQNRGPQQRPVLQSTVTDQQIQEYQRHKEFLLKQQALQSKLAPPPAPVASQASHIPVNRFHNRQPVQQQQRQPLPHIHVEQSPIIDQTQLSPQVERFITPTAPTQNTDYGNRLRSKETQQGIGKFPERNKGPNHSYFVQYASSDYNSQPTLKPVNNRPDNTNNNAELIKSISSLEDHQVQPALNINTRDNLNPIEIAPNHKPSNHQTQSNYRIRNQPQATHHSTEQRNSNTRYNVRNEEDFNQQHYPQISQQSQGRFNFRDNQYTTKQPHITKSQEIGERQPDISKYLTVYSRPPNSLNRRPTPPTPTQQNLDNRILQTTAAPSTEVPKAEQTEQKNDGTESPEEEERKKANIAALPDEVPDDLRQQLLSSGILGNADIQILDYDKVGDIPIESLPPEALENFYGAASNPVPSIVKPPGGDQQQAVEMRVVRYDPNSDEAITNKYFQENATKIDPVFLNGSKYKRYLPLKVSGAQFPLPDVPQLKDRTVNSVVVLAPVDYDFIKPQDDSEDGRRGRIIQIQGVKFVVGDSLMTVIKNPTQDNFKSWLKNELAVPSDQQSVILLITK